jgi:phage shock protein E
MNNLIFLLLGLFIGYTLFKKFIIARTNFKALMQEGAIIIDVRSPQEYDQGHIQGAINMPLQQLPNQLAALKAKNKTIIACCASGMRSGSACGLMKQQGITCVNGGGWKMLQNKLNA